MDMNLGKLWEMGRDREAWAPCNPWGCKESDMTGQLNKNKELVSTSFQPSSPNMMYLGNWRPQADHRSSERERERDFPVITKCNLRLLFGYTASHFWKHGARPWNFAQYLFLFKMSLSAHFNKPPLQTCVYMGRENRKRAEHMFTAPSNSLDDHCAWILGERVICVSFSGSTFLQHQARERKFQTCSTRNQCCPMIYVNSTLHLPWWWFQMFSTPFSSCGFHFPLSQRNGRHLGNALLTRHVLSLESCSKCWKIAIIISMWYIRELCFGEFM